MIVSFLRAARAYFDLFPLLSRLSLWRYVILCGMISTALGTAIFFTGYSFLGSFADVLVSWYPFETGSEIIQSIANFLAGSILFLGGLFSYKYLIIIVLSPVLSYISEKMEYALSGERAVRPFSLTGILSDLIRGIRISLRNIIYELSLIVLIFAATFFLPVVNVFSTLLIFLVQAYYAGFSNFDFYLERYFGLSESISFVKQRRGLALGNGSIFLLILLIPVLGWFLAPVIGAMAATLTIHPEVQPSQPPFKSSIDELV